MKAFFVLGLMTIAAGGSAGAQLSGYHPAGEPTIWIGGGVGAFNAQGVNDGKTGSTWDFGQRTSWQYRASLEKAIQNQSSIGLVGTLVHVPFTYGGNTGTPCGTVGGGAISQCAAHLDVASLAALFHAGGGTGFHQVIEISAGVTAYRNLKRDSDGAALPPKSGNMDGTLLFGYGFGYGLSQNTEVTLVQDYGLVLHESDKLPSNASNTNTIRTLRVGLRYGFGSRRPQVRRR